MMHPDTDTKKVTVIIPCYNEAASIGDVVTKFPRSKLAQNGVQLHVLVVDNNSSDNTTEIARSAGATVIQELKQGKGNALRTGFRAVPDDTDYVVMLDGDDTYSAAEIARVIEPLRSDFCDVVVGSRLAGFIKTAAMSKLNRAGNRMFTGLVRLLYRANVSDVLTGYFAWKKSALDALEPHITSQGFAIEMEMITKMARLGQQMAAVPISYDPRAGESHLHPLRDGSRILWMLLKNLAWHAPQPQTVMSADSAQAATDVQGESVPKKIVFVSDAIYPYMKGGKEKRLHEITKHLSAMGNDVHIYSMHWWPGPETELDQDGVHLHALCKYHEMYHGDRRTITEGVLFGFACFKLFGVRFDVLDVDHMPFFPVFSAWIVCSLRRRKLYATWHEALSHQEWMSYMGRSGVIAELIEWISIRLPHRITAASAHTQELLATAHGRHERVELVASGVDTSLIRAVQPAQVRCDVLYVGRLVKDKNVDKLILAVGIVAEQYPEVQCLIVGSGIEKEHLLQTVLIRRLQKNVTFVEPVPEAAKVYAMMKAAKVFCLPSVREGFSIVTLEALACGTPVVTVDNPGNAARHLVHDGQNGSIVQLEPMALAAAISAWIAAAPKPTIAEEVADHDWGNLARMQARVYTL